MKLTNHHRIVLAALVSSCALVAIAHDLAVAPSKQETPAAAPRKIVQRNVTENGATVVTLDNGLTVIVKPSRLAPVVCVKSLVGAGSLHEGRWRGAGISHLLEHLVAKGAVHDGEAAGQAKQTVDRVTQIGGQSNAYTSNDYTGYFISASAGKTDDCIDLIADWMARAEITREDFEREHGVVQRELEMGRDDASRQLWYAHAASFWANHPAASPVIGYMDPLRKLTYEDVLEYHRLKYVPQNMVFVVVGDVDVEAVLDRVCKAFAGFESGVDVDRIVPQPSPLAGVRRVVRQQTDMSEAMQHMAFMTIPLVHEDLYALDLLSDILTSGRSSRLVQRIQRGKQLVTSVSSSSWTPHWGKGMFNISFRAAPDKADAAEQAILDELRAVIADGVDEQELASAKRRKTAEFVYAQQSVDDQAGTLASDWHSTGDIDFSANYTQRIQNVTAEQVRQAAAKYLTFDAMAITRLVPPQQDQAQATEQSSAAKEAAGESFTLPNGLRVVLVPSDGVGLVSMTMATIGGVLAETPQTNGLGTLAAALSTRGAGELSAEQIDAFFDEAGGGVSGNCGNNTLYWQATVLDDRFDRALEIFADVIQRPRFEQKELDLLRPILLARIQQTEESPQGQAGRFFREKFFVDSPLSMLPIGSADVVGSAELDQIRAHHAAYVRAGSSVLAICGNFDAAAARQRVEKLFGDMPDGEIPRPNGAARTIADGGETHVLPTNKQVAAVYVGAPGMTLADVDDKIAIDVLDTIISGYHLPAGWLHEGLRGRQLVYVVHAYNQPSLVPGAFVTYALCQPEKAAEVMQIIRDELTRAAGYTPTKDEIDEAVNVILTADVLGNQQVSEIAMAAALDELYGFGWDFRRRMEHRYRALTPADILRVGQKYLGQGLVFTVCTPRPELLEER